MQTVAAIVITFNRLAFLNEIIDAIRQQSRKPDAIFIINNSSTDGTDEWLNQQSDLTIIRQENSGSSGGQFTGFKAVFDAGYDWIWTMDDDVVPAQNSLEILLQDFDENTIRSPLRYTIDGEPFLNDAINYNLTNPFSSIWIDIIGESDLKNKFTEAIGITFEGPLIHRSIVEKIGFPERNFFIFADDTEFFIRAWKAGFRTVIINQAKFQRKLPVLNTLSEFSWKTYYQIRNIIAIDVLHGTLPVRIIRPIGYLIVWLLRCKKAGDIWTVLRAFFDGYFYRTE
jgi:GT2 family glycosyltransferase